MVIRVLKIIALSFLCLSVLSCGQGRGGDGGNKVPATVERPFPKAYVPSTIVSETERERYLAEHYWDAFLSGEGPTDTALVLGVRKAEVEQAFSNYTALIGAYPLERSDALMHTLFSKVSARQKKDTSSFFYTVFNEIVSRYLYDPNSPLRDEDLYLPYVQDMAISDLTGEEMLAAYRYEASSCSVNRRGSVAPDFRITTAGGRVFRLHSIRAERTLLFFSNPGCRNCREIGEGLMSDAVLVRMMEEGRLAVVNVYIDEDLAEWRKYVSTYPELWHSGYDAAHAVRDGRLYDVRAIPSLYLLDAEKRVLLKDAPLEKVIYCLK